MRKISRLVICVALTVILAGAVSAYAADGSTDITLTVSDGSDYTIVIPSEKTEEAMPPQTGDNSNIFLWLALLFVSGGAVMATTIVGRKKRRAE
jgi:LPXTG-motif cell wall-anchored protein